MSAAASENDALSHVMARLLEAYPGKWGNCLIRVEERGKRPLDKGWNRSARDRFESSRDPGPHLVEMADHLARDGNLGLALPLVALVLDADTEQDAAALESLLPDAPRQNTKKGAHFVLRAPGGIKIPQLTKVLLGEGVKADLRVGGRGFIVIAPSVHESGIIYEWLRPLPLDLDRLPDLPAPLLKNIRQALRASDTPPNKAITEESIGEGGRHAFLVSEAGRLFSAGYCGGRLLAALRGLNREICEPSSPDKELVDIVREASRSWDRGGHTQANEDWDEPTDFRTPRLDEFPAIALPPCVRDASETVANALGNPLGMAAQVALGSFAFAASRVARVAINETFSVPTNLYTAVVAPPGAGKSPTLEPLVAPIRAWRREVLETYGGSFREEQALWDAKRKAIEGDIERAAKRPEEERDARLADAAGQKGLHESSPRPMIPKYITGDFTEAALGGLLACSNERAIVMNDEGSSLFQSLAGRYSKSSQTEASLFASCWSGSSYDEDRIGRQGVGLENPLLSVVTMIQPGVLRGLNNLQALGSQGVLDRFCWSVSSTSTVPANPPAMNPEALAEYGNVMLQILRIPSVRKPEPEFLLQLSNDAREARTLFIEGLNRAVESGGELEGLSGLVSKLRSNVERTSGVLHLIKYPSNGAVRIPISGDTQAEANMIGRYWLNHARHVHGSLQAPPGLRQAELILGHIERLVTPNGNSDGNLDETGRIDRSVLLLRCRNGTWGAIQNRDDFNLGLDVLEEHGYVREWKDGRKRRVIINPLLRRGQLS